MSSSQVAVAGQAPGRTKRVYRYLDGGQSAQAGAKHRRRSSSNNNPRDAASSSASASPTSSAGAAGGEGAERREKRAKVGRACLYCKRSHMACEDKRPCFRCVSRGIGVLCLDDEAQASGNSTAPTSTQTALSRHSTRTHDAATRNATTRNMQPSPDEGERAPSEEDPAMDLSINNILAAFDSTPGSFARMDLPLDWTEFQGQDPTAQQPLLQPQTQHTLALPGTLDTFGSSPDGASLDNHAGQHAGRPLLLEALADHPGKEVRKRPRPWDHILATAYNAEDSTVRPYQYAYGYARLQRWTRSSLSGWSTEGVERVHLLLQEEIRPRLRARWQRLSDLQLVEEEQRFLAVVDHVRHNVCEAIDVPLVVLRRTWEIVCANEAWASLCQMDVGCFDSGRLCLYQLLSEALAVETFERCVGEGARRRMLAC